MIPKLFAQTNEDAQIDVPATLKAFGVELSYTLSKLRKVERCHALTPRIEGPQAEVEKLKTEPEVSKEVVLALLDTINNLRCDLLVELTRIACVDGRAANWPQSFFREPASEKTSPATPAPPARGPNSAQSWIDVANERASDAQSMLKDKRAVGSVYMAGYAIECSLKGLLRNRGDKFPTSGGAGHDLQALWKVSGFKLRDLNDTNGAKAYFIENWSTDLRYDGKLTDTTPLQSSDLLNGAGQLVSFIQTQAKRRRGHR